MLRLRHDPPREKRATAADRVLFRGLAIMMAALILSALPYGCASVNPHYDPAKPHHTPYGFRNNYTVDEARSLWEVIHWRLTGDRPDPPPGGWPIASVTPDKAWLRENRTEASFTWLGHAGLLVQLDGKNILADPHLTERASPFSWLGPKRIQPPPFAVGELPRIDVVLISHNHYDHLDHATVTALARQAGGPPIFLVPLGLKRWFDREGIAGARELDWWDRTAIGGVVIHFVPANHWSARTRADRNESLWGGFIVEGAGRRFHFAGDTGYSADFKDIAQRFGPIDLSAIPIGAYAPRWFMKTQHVNPAEAAQIFIDLKARAAVGVHWGTFPLTDEPMDEPPKLLAAARRERGIADDAFFTMAVGETRRFDSLPR